MCIKDDLLNYITELCQAIKARPTGSLSNKKTENYIEKTLKHNGLTVTKQNLPCINWENLGATLFINGEPCDIYPSNYSAPCELTASYICIDTLDKLNSCSVKNKILVLYGDLCKEPLAPKNFPWYNPEEHQAIIKALEEKQPSALITVSYDKSLPLSIIEDGDFNIPCAVVSLDKLSFLLNHTNYKMNLKINTKRNLTTAHNILAHYGNPANKKITFSAHLDTNPITPGALDNGTGVATLLALSSKLALNHSPYYIELAFFNGEDYYNCIGETTYMNTYLTKPDEYKFAVNIDGVGLKGSKNSYSFYSCNDKLIKSIKHTATIFETLEEIQPWPQGDHTMFAFSGVPAIALTSSNIFDPSLDILHSLKDNIDVIDFDTLEQVINFCLDLLLI